MTSSEKLCMTEILLHCSELSNSLDIVSHLISQIDLFPGGCLILDLRKYSIFSGVGGCDWVQPWHQQLRFRGPHGEKWGSCVSGVWWSGQIFDTPTLGCGECCCHVWQVYGTLLTLNPTAIPIPLFLNWQRLPLMREAEGVRGLLCHPPSARCSHVTRGLTSEVWWEVCFKERFSSLIKRGWGHGERGPTSPDKKEAKTPHFTLPACGYWHERMRHLELPSLSCDKKRYPWQGGQIAKKESTWVFK